MRARLALEEDRVACISLAYAAAREREPDLVWSEGVAQETFDLCLAGSSTMLIVEKGGEVIGLAIAHINGFQFSSGIFVSVSVLYVRPDMRGTRAAATLVQELLDWSAGLGAKRLYFGTVGCDAIDDRLVKLLGRFGASRSGYAAEVKL